MAARRPIPLALLAVVAATTAPVPAPPVGRWFAELADADPAVRDAARERLMGLSADDLPTLREAVRAAGPVAPAQAEALPEIVRQVFLAADPYDVDDGPRQWIMGQGWPRDVRHAERLGVPVVNRWPGFPARRWLRDGDLILGLYLDPDAPVGRPVDWPTHDVDDLIEGTRRCPSLPRLGLLVLREGRPIRVTASLVPEPAATVGRQPSAVAGFLNDRQRRADDYWREQFAPVVTPPAVAGVDLDGSADGTGR